MWRLAFSIVPWGYFQRDHLVFCNCFFQRNRRTRLRSTLNHLLILKLIIFVHLTNLPKSRVKILILLLLRMERFVLRGRESILENLLAVVRLAHDAAVVGPILIVQSEVGADAHVLLFQLQLVL